MATVQAVEALRAEVQAMAVRFQTLEDLVTKQTTADAQRAQEHKVLHEEHTKAERVRKAAEQAREQDKQRQAQLELQMGQAKDEVQEIAKGLFCMLNLFYQKLF